ncbi:N-acetylglucosamine-specific PTS transporter subunit IIBC [Alicyclobacillus macrosporangiidus]|uniref:PTS system, N-acetylglucosamine-specific IIC component n=1 Tax=Alicyclobacillus macrosporangiidus TaxID=392015 RepID=A0A1I7GYX6_9BACL|nr:N-acetylglucosamine-specific PTS transporter subunit IIBC [Alicyclobacillus macrosporangiidus]SFU53661.1 PTS system, N-acetylglucosamine-specific IIC component [Alicyclobacillus macrosporangiidus]
MLGQLQRIGKALMLPVAVLPAAALLLRFGQPDLLNIPFIAQAGNAIFANLAVIFAIGVAIGLAKGNHGAAGLAGFIGYEVLTQGAQAINKDINMGVLGGIIAGILAGWLYNRFHQTRLPDWLGFFGGRRFVPIVTAGAAVVLAAVFGYVWPYVQDGLDAFGHTLTTMGAFGAAIYGFLNRLLIPFGLHHVLNAYIWFVYGTFHGKTGDLNRFFAGDPTAGGYMAGFYPIFMFGLPAACLAMILAAKKERRAAVAGVLLSAAFASFLTGITEPIEFSFMFLAPALYALHAVLTGVSMGVAYALGIKHGFGFSAGAIDYFLNMHLATHGWWLLPLGLVFGVVYFVLFYVCIRAFNIKTPGREDEGDAQAGGFALFDENQLRPAAAEAAAASGAAVAARAAGPGGTADATLADKAAAYVVALGGPDNIRELEGCVTRLRLTVVSADRLDEPALRRLGASGVMKLDPQHVQVVVGTIADMLAEEIQKRLR